MKLSYDSLAAQLERPLLPAWLISGDEPLLTGEAADAVRARARTAGFTEREVHFPERGSGWEEIRASASTLSLFASRRIIEIRLPGGRAGREGNAVLAGLLEAPQPDVLLLILTGRLERDVQSAEWVRAIEAHGAWLPVWPVEAARLPQWLRGRCRRLGLEADDEALAALAERTEGNLLAAHQELEKLRLLLPGGRVTLDAVLGSAADSARFDVFQLSEAVLEGDAARALRILAGLRTEGVEPVLVLWAVAKALHDLWSSCAPGGAARPRLNPRQAAALEKGRRRAARLPYAALVTRATRADRMAKGRLAGDVWNELALLAADLCGRPVLAATAVVK